MPMDKGYKSGYKSTPSAKPAMGNCGGKPVSTSASNAGNSGRAIQSGPFKRTTSQKAWTGTKL